MYPATNSIPIINSQEGKAVGVIEHERSHMKGEPNEQQFLLEIIIK